MIKRFSKRQRPKHKQGLLARLLGRRGGALGSPKLEFQTSSELLDRYVGGMPTRQNAIDAVPGWTGAMPPETGLRAGKAYLFADTRIRWLLDQYDVAGKTVLELGPLEGFHTLMVDRCAPASIDAIEANALAFVRCLITKEVLWMPRANFFLGDFTKWLENTDKHYDLLIASGVLYHSHDPVHLLELIGKRADAIFIWTHYFDDAAMPLNDLRRVPFSEQVQTRTSHGIAMRLYERSYYKAWRDPSFCGGLQDQHFWLDRSDILALLGAMGFKHLNIADEQPDHPNGPSFSIFARREAQPVRSEEAANVGAGEEALPPAPVPQD